MTGSVSTHHGRRLFEGTVRVFMSEALVLPTGLVLAAFLTRRLGPDGYGLYILSVTLVLWIQLTASAIFSRTTIKFLGEADDWRPIAKTVIRVYLLISCAAVLLVWFAAVPLGRLLDEPRLAPLLRLLALDIPLFCLAQVHRDILVGTGRFNQRALVSASRWISRLLLIILLVQVGLSVSGALLGTIGASLVSLVIARLYVRPSVFGRTSFPARRLLGFAAPLFLSAVAMQLFNKIDLWMLKALGGTASDAGVYGAAQNLALILYIFSFSFTPLLLSTLSHMEGSGDSDGARKLARNAMRLVILLLPLAALTAGAAPEIVVLIYGHAFAAAAPVLCILMFGAVAAAMIYVSAVILIAAGRPGWVLGVSWCLPLLAIGGHLVLIPRFGLVGASIVTTTVATLGALGAVVAVYRTWRIAPPTGSVIRGVLVGVLAYGLSAWWTTPGLLLLVKLSVSIAVLVAAMVLLGEFSRSEMASATSLLLRRPFSGDELNEA